MIFIAGPADLTAEQLDDSLVHGRNLGPTLFANDDQGMVADWADARARQTKKPHAVFKLTEVLHYKGR